MSRSTASPVAYRKPSGPLVLVWQQYGCTKVHPASTPGHLTAILAAVSNTVADWEDERLDPMILRVTSLVEQGQVLRATREIESFCSRHKDHETFEVFEFCEIQELM